MTIALLAAALLLAPSHVALRHDAGAWVLTVDGKPFTIKGAGGDASKSALAAIGGNSFRTWGANGIDGQLEEANRLGLKVTVGIWLGHKEQGFRYDNPDQVNRQLETAKAVIEKYKDNPAVLMWGIGNEMEGYDQGDDPNVWTAVEDIAHAAHRLDPNHPTMTVVAEIGGRKVPAINAMCPSIDVVGINSYGGASSVYDRYVKQGGTKPYVITEFGPPGQWESKSTPWQKPIEPTSTEKEDWYARAYQANVLAHPDLCLGGYAFTWGHKQEATATWYGMFLPDGSKVGAVDVMQRMWTGKAPDRPCPRIASLTLDGEQAVDPGESVVAHLAATDPEGDPLTVSWALTTDSGVAGIGGANEDVPDQVPGAIVASNGTGATVKMPATPGSYRLFVVIHNAHQGAAVANIPLRVRGAAPTALGGKANLPVTLYADAGGPMPYVPSGWMGNQGAMKLDMASTDHPHSGTTCIRWDYTASDGWAGIAWQSPEGDWGDKPGGLDLTGAKKLTLWARGMNGGETVTFSVGIIKSDKKYCDTAIVDGGKRTLSDSWQKYEVPLDGRDLTRIKTGLVMIVGGQGHPVTIFIDDIRIE